MSTAQPHARHWRDYTEQLTSEQIALIEEREQLLVASIAETFVAVAELATTLNDIDDDEELARMQRWFRPVGDDAA
jgi:hypothetical protein